MVAVATSASLGAAAPSQTPTTSTGSIVGWGWDNLGQATPPAGDDYAAIAGGHYHSVALKADGSLVAWGSGSWGQTPAPPGDDYVAIASGTYHGLALKTDGSIVGWGWNTNGQATPPAGNDYVALAAGQAHSLALKADGSLVGWGNNFFGQASPPAGHDYVAIASGTYHGLALRSDGSIVGWGRNGEGQANPPSGNDYEAIAAGEYHGLALKSDGSLIAWGASIHDYGQATPPAGTDYEAVSAGAIHSLALKTDGSIVGWGAGDPQNDHSQANPPADDGYVAIAGGEYHSLALKRTAPPQPPNIEEVTGPIEPVAINDQSAVEVGVVFTDPDSPGGHVVTWDWGDDLTDTEYDATSPAAHSHNFAEPGVYQVTVTVADDDGGTDTDTFDYVVVYDPSAGFVTGGGWIESPEGAYVADPELTGKATFGFVSKYKKGATVPTGNTEFHFHAGDLNFHSDSYDWLVIAGKDKAKFKGAGTINGAGEYGFMLTATDDDSGDTFRIKIWDATTDTVVYDNKAASGDETYDGTALGGGNIKVHKR